MSALAVPSGRVAVGLPSALSNMLSYELLVQVRSTYPQIVLHLTDGNSSLLRERLDNGRLDIAVLFVGQQERGLAVEPIATEELFYITAEKGSRSVKLEEVARRPLLLPGPGSGIEKAVREAFRQRGLQLTVIGEIDTMTTLQRAVSAGLGNTILPWAAIEEENGERKLHYRRISDFNLARPVAICFSEVSQQNPAVEAVASTLKNVVSLFIDKRRWQGVSAFPTLTKSSNSMLPK